MKTTKIWIQLLERPERLVYTYKITSKLNIAFTISCERRRLLTIEHIQASRSWDYITFGILVCESVDIPEVPGRHDGWRLWDLNMICTLLAMKRRICHLTSKGTIIIGDKCWCDIKKIKDLSTGSYNTYLTLSTQKYFCINHGNQRFLILNHHKCLSQLFLHHLDTYNMGIRPL